MALHPTKVQLPLGKAPRACDAAGGRAGSCEKLSSATPRITIHPRGAMGLRVSSEVTGWRTGKEPSSQWQGNCRRHDVEGLGHQPCASPASS